MEQLVSYTLDSTLDTVDNAEQMATRIAQEMGFGEDEVMQISMAVREGAVNAVLHGNAYAPDKKVILAFERTSDGLVITIRDQGKGIDLGGIPNRFHPGLDNAEQMATRIAQEMGFGRCAKARSTRCCMETRMLRR
jgi:anti-sigma regulatory factor (Ser/Thr protein kinase)